MCSERGWCSEDSHNLRQPEYEIILELSGEFPVRLLCESMGIRRNSFYHWKKRLSDPAPKTKMPADNVSLFREYHMKYPSHGYRWLMQKSIRTQGLKSQIPMRTKAVRLQALKADPNITGIKSRAGRAKCIRTSSWQVLKLTGRCKCGMEKGI